MLFFTPNADKRAFLGTFHTPTPVVTLGNIGDVLTLTFDFRFTLIPGIGATGNTDNTFRFGFYNYNGTLLTADYGTQANNDFGYAAFARIGNVSTSSHAVKEAGTNVDIFNGTDVSNLGGHVTDVDIRNTAVHSAILELTRQASGMKIEAKIDGTEIVNVMDTSLPYYSFNEVAMGVGVLGGNRQFYTDNINVNYTPAPLPPTALLLGSGLLALGLLRLRKRA